MTLALTNCNSPSLFLTFYIVLKHTYFQFFNWIVFRNFLPKCTIFRKHIIFNCIALGRFLFYFDICLLWISILLSVVTIILLTTRQCHHHLFTIYDVPGVPNWNLCSKFLDCDDNYGKFLGITSNFGYSRLLFNKSLICDLIYCWLRPRWIY